MSIPGRTTFLRCSAIAALCFALPATAQIDDQEAPETPVQEAEEIDADENEEHDPEELEPEELEEARAPIPTRVTADRGAIDRALRASVERGGYRFCTDQRFRLRRGDRDLCALAEAAAQRCPEFRAACQRPDDGRAAATPKPRERKKRDSARPFELPSTMSGLARAIFWTLIAIGIVALVIAIAKNVMPSKRNEPSEVEPDGAKAEQAPAQARGPIETDAERLLARARAKATHGDYSGALTDVHAALLRHLDQSGLITLHSASTNGEYVRSLREHPDLRQTLKSSAREVERVQFGAAAATDEVFQRLLGAVGPIVSRAGMLTLIVAVLCPLLAGCEFLEEAEQAGDGRTTWGRGPGGVSMLVETLEEQGLTVRHRVRSLEQIEPEIGGIVSFDPFLDEKEWAALFNFAENGGLLVIAADSGIAAKRLGVHSVSADCDGKLNFPAAYVTQELFGEARLITTPGAALRIENRAHWPIVECKPDLPYVVGGRLGSGGFVILPNADLLTNAALAAGDNAYFWAGLLGNNPGTIELVGPWTGGGASSPFEAVANTRLTPLLVQLLLLLAVVYLWRGAHFGTPRDPPAQSRRVFAEHVRALGLVYAKARASRLVLAAYAGWVLDRLRERLQPGTDGTLHGLAHVVALHTGRAEGEVMRILVEARTARDAIGRAEGSPEDLQVMRELEQLLKETGKKP